MSDKVQNITDLPYLRSRQVLETFLPEINQTMNNQKYNDFFGCLIHGVAEDYVDQAKVENEINEFIDLITPQASGRKLVRIGKAGDGSYLLPYDLEGVTACYSPGVNNFKDFEDSLVKNYGIQCHMCDASSDPEHFRTGMIEGMQTFRKVWLDVTGNDDSISLRQWVAETTVPGDGDLLLQMDIEGAEYRNFLETDVSVLKKFRIMVIEFHGLDKIIDNGVRAQVLLPVFRKLNQIFEVVHAHPNNFDGEFLIKGTNIYLSKFLELTMYRRDRIAIPPVGRISPTLIPHPKDIVNMRSRPPVFLDSRLLPSKRALRSRLKIFSDWSLYYLGVVARSIRGWYRKLS